MGALTLRRRLTLLVALTIVVPITAVGVTVVNIIGNQGEQRDFERLRLTAGYAQTRLSELHEELARRAAVLVDDPTVARALASGGTDVDGLETTLRRTLSDESIDVLLVTTPDGTVVGGARREPDVAGDEHVPTYEELATASPPPSGVLLASADAAQGRVQTGVWLDAVRLRTLTRSSDVVVAAVSGRKVVASTGPLGALPDRSLQGEFQADFGGGGRRLAVTAEVPAGDTVLLVTSRPESDTSRASLIVLFAALLVVLVVLVILVGYVVSGLVTGPVETLVDAALTVARGDLTKRVDVSGDQELVALGHAFNQMTDNLREYVTKLQQSRTEFQTAIARLGDVLVSTHDIGGIIGVVLEAATLTMRADLSVFYERVAMPARIRASAANGGPVPEIELNGSGIAGAAARTLGPATYPGIDALDAAEPQVSGALAVPVVSEGRLFGVLAVYGRAGDSLFSAEDVDTLQTLARQTEVAIGNVMLHDETRRQARTDGLTGLWNRREFELRAREAVKESDRFSEPFGVVLADIDDFKQVNDRFDHTTGDAALIWLASRLSEATREIDVVARWGGEEFIVLLPRAGREETAMVAERVRAAVAREPMVDGSRIIPVTVSLGYAVHPEDGHDAEELFKAADAALLRAKRLGKNRVEHATTDEGVA
jgi:two-component system cell cycle response regulator